MTAVYPPPIALPVGGDHLVAWIAGYLAACASIEQAAYQAGRRDALRAVALNVAELDIIGGAKDRRFLREAAARIRARHEGYEQKAQERYVAEGRQEYRGGPVPVWGGGEAA